MRFFRRIRAAVLAQVTRNADLIVLWVLLVVAQQHVPITHYLGRQDLLPWLTLTLSVLALLRGRSLGPGPHPMLTPRVSSNSAWFQRGALVVAPWALLFWYDAGHELSFSKSAIAVGLSLLLLLLLVLGAPHGQTAWRPVRDTPWFPWVAGSLLFIVTVLTAGAASALLPLDPLRWVGQSVLLGAMFVGVGLVAGRVQHHQQRAVAGLKGGRRYRPALFPMVLAATGPASGLLVVLLVLGDLPFTQAFVFSLLVLVWGSIIWPAPQPHAVAVMLHEVNPTGGRDLKAIETANPFDKPPEGALRFNPIRSERTRSVHTWLVPVVGSRIEGLDDPIAPLWPVRPPFRPSHTLGDARFEPDPLTRETQCEVLTVHLKTEEGAADIASGEVQTKRMVVLRAHIPPGFDHRRRKRTYRWEKVYARDAVQVLDDTVERALLIDGDVLLLSQEGVAHAYEIEVGSPIYRAADAFQFRPGQLEDYVKAG